MIAFLNERSFEEHMDWGAGLRMYWEVAVALAGNDQLFKDSYFFLNDGFKQRFSAALTGLSPEIRAAIRQVAFSDRYWHCWRPTRASSDADTFACERPEALLADESLCEATERKLAAVGLEVSAVSVPGSTFAEVPMLLITKIGMPEPAELPNVSSVVDVQRWITESRGFYDPESRTAPLDFQTILLKDLERFHRTNRMRHVAGKDRRIYLEVATGNLFYVDEGHSGHSAHLEVFDSNGMHLGEADISTGVLNPAKRDARKTI